MAGKRASMREGPLAALFRRTDEESPEEQREDQAAGPEPQRAASREPEPRESRAPTTRSSRSSRLRAAAAACRARRSA